MKLAALLAFLLVVGTGVCRAANPSYADFGTNQFTNVGVAPILKVNISSNALLTNPVATSVTIPHSIPGNANLNIRGGIALATNDLGVGVWIGNGFSESNVLSATLLAGYYASFLCITNGTLVESNPVSISIGGFPHTQFYTGYRAPSLANSGSNLLVHLAGRTNILTDAYAAHFIGDGARVSNLLAQGTNTLYVSPTGATQGIPGNPLSPWSNLSNAVQYAITNGISPVVIDMMGSTNGIVPIGSTGNSLVTTVSPINVSNVIDMTIRNGQIISSVVSNGNFIRAYNTTNFRVIGVTFSYPGTKPTNSTGTVGSGVNAAIYYFSNNINPCVFDSRFVNLPSHGIFGSVQTNSSTSGGIISALGGQISRNYFETVGGTQAAALNDGTAVDVWPGVQVLDNFITNCFRGVEFCCGEALPVTNVIIQNNFIHTIDNGIISVENTDGTNQYRDAVIQNNVLRSAIKSDGGTNYPSTNFLIGLSYSSGFLIQGNDLGGYMVSLVSSNNGIAINGSNNVVRGNNFHNLNIALGFGSAPAATNISTLARGNFFWQNGSADTIQIANNNVTVDGNTVYDSVTGQRLILLLACTNTTLRNNFVNASGAANQYAVLVDSTASQTIFENNRFISNAVAGNIGGISNAAADTVVRNHEYSTTVFGFSSNLWVQSSNIVSTNLSIIGTSSTLTPPTTNWWTLTGTNPSGIPFPVILSWVPGMTNVASATLPTRSPIQTNIPNGTTNQFTFGMLYTNTGPKSMFHARVQITAGATTDAHARLMISNSVFGTAFTEIDSVGTPAATGVVGVTNWLSGIIDTGEFFYVTNDNGVVMTTNTPNWYFRQQ